MSRCPDSTRIAAYLDDRLFEEERRVLEEHFAGCESCWREFADSVACLAELRAEETTAVPAPRRLARLKHRLATKHGRSAAIAATLALVVGASGWLSYDRLVAPAAGEASELHAGVVERRPVVPRFTGAEWKPRPSDRVRGVTAAPSLEPGAWRYQKRVDEARLAAGDSPSGAQLQRLGAAYLLAGDADQGLQTLERATAAVPEDAHALSDLGAAYLARGIERDDGNDVAQALETIDRALEGAPDLLEARFNRALALEEMTLPGEASRAWRMYLELDARSPWAEEARERLEHLARRPVEVPAAAQLRAAIVAAATAGDVAKLAALVDEHRQEAREAFQLDLMPAWGAATIDGDAVDAAEHFASAARLAALWERQTEDRSLARQIADVERSPLERMAFARGHQALARGIDALEALQLEPARTALATARRELPASAAARAWADLYTVACDFYRQGPEPALSRRLEALLPLAESDAPLRAYLGWMRGLLHFGRGEPQAIELYEQSLREFERLEEIDHVAWLHSLSGDALTLFGDLPRAWSHRREVLAAFPRLTHGERRFEVLLGPAIGAAYLERRPHVAASLLSELASQPQGWAPRQSAELQLWLSRVRTTLGDRKQALAHWQAAKAWLWQVEDRDIRQRLAAELQAASGSIATSPAAAVAALSKTIDRSRGGAPDFRYPGLLLERARAYRLLGDEPRALADLREGVDWLSRQPAAGPVQSLWSQRLARGDDLFDELVAAELAAGQLERAFVAAERDRWRTFSRSVGTQRGAARPLAAEDMPSTLMALRKELGPGTALLYFCLLDKEALLWRVESAGVSTIRLQAPPAAITARATQLQTDLAAGAWTSHTGATARGLYRDLILPAGLGDDVRRLVIVPDGPLDQLPFAALVDPRSGRFLVEQRTVEVSPSAASFLAGRTRQEQLRSQPPSVLAFGDPLPDSELYPTLRPLAAAREEARLVARSYRRREVLVGERATREALLARAGDYSVLHFAGHAVNNLVDPSRSSLALAHAPNSDQPGAVFAYELAPAHFDRTRLVVLAGCGTGSGPASGGSETLSLARAFLAARVPTVVASFWPVADGRTVELMTALHTGLARGQEPAAALRAAQLSLLRSGDPGLRSPSTWAAFGVLGG
jgi:CHAT domain-containing protein